MSLFSLDFLPSLEQLTKVVSKESDSQGSRFGHEQHQQSNDDALFRWSSWCGNYHTNQGFSGMLQHFKPFTDDSNRNVHSNEKTQT